jgi:WD40 repeat protein/uncharacterized caspase-like protein
MLPIGHISKVSKATFSPDGKYIVTIGSSENTAKIWDVISGILLTDLIGHTGFVVSAEFSPDGKKIVTASNDSTANVWDAKTGILLFNLIGHTSFVVSAEFSTDGKKIVTASYDNKAKVWDATTGNLLTNVIGHTDRVLSARFNSDGNKIITASWDSTAIIWDAETGKLLQTLKGNKSEVKMAKFSPDDKNIVTISWDSTAKIWDPITGSFLFDLKGHTGSISSIEFSPDRKKIVTGGSSDKTAKVWDAITGVLLVNLIGHTGWVYSAEFSPDGAKIVTSSSDETTKIWDAAKGSLLFNLNGHKGWVNSAKFNLDVKKVVTASNDKTIKIWDVMKGSLLFDLKGHTKNIFSVELSPDGKKIIAASGDNTAKILNAASSVLSANLKNHTSFISSASFSPDGKFIVTAGDQTVRVWNAITNDPIINLEGHESTVKIARFSNNGENIVTASSDGTVKIFTTSNWKLQQELVISSGHIWGIDAHFSPDGKKLITTTLDSTVKIWEIISGNLISELNMHNLVTSAIFSPDGKKIITTSSDSMVKIWDEISGKFLSEYKCNNCIFNSAEFSPDGKKIFAVTGQHIERIGELMRLFKNFMTNSRIKIWDVATGLPLNEIIIGPAAEYFTKKNIHFSPDGKRFVSSVGDNTIKIWDTETGNQLYTFFAVDSSEYLVYDKDYHYDGTPAARKLLYFTCGTEIIELEQLKDQLWVPNLAERITNGETINAQKLSDLNICNLTPVVDTIEQTALQYRFQITPRLGGLGATIVYVNGIEVKRYTPLQLIKQKEVYQLAIDKKELQKFFASGKENSIVVKSLTAKNSISSRSASISEKGKEISAVPPNLYAVVVGVSDYKGEGLDLKFAAKDAVDMGNALDASAKKLLNTDGKEHVFIYRINTGSSRDKFPEKNSIKQVFTEIAGKAQPNDILLVFFAGHGVMEAEKNQFYFLTADASNTTVFGALKDVGISTDELTEWIKPQVMKAQKRILIFDACNSGQFIKEMISIGNKEQNFLASRGDEDGKQIKAIEKLNERSGLFILSASASNQKAYEIGKYNQGALTYSLLKAIKEEPDILEDRKYLNISRWFNAAEKTVGELARETGARQQPQIVSTTNFNIGVVDEEVRNNIVLPFEKPMFTRSDFRNTALRIDNLKLRSLVDKQLDEISGSGSGASIMYSPEYDGANVFAISGDYTVTGNEISVSVILTKGGTEIITRIEAKGVLADLGGLSRQITASLIDWLKKK